MYLSDNETKDGLDVVSDYFLSGRLSLHFQGKKRDDDVPACYRKNVPKQGWVVPTSGKIQMNYFAPLITNLGS